MESELRFSEIANLLQGRLVGGDGLYTSVCTDTRSINTGDLFVALKGERFDAHNFLDKAVSEGAVPSMPLPELLGSDNPALADIMISGMQLDSRRVRSGDVFLAMPGEQHDGRQFLSTFRHGGKKVSRYN